MYMNKVMFTVFLFSFFDQSASNLVHVYVKCFVYFATLTF